MEEVMGGAKTFTIIRKFNAPRELVWKAWTDPKLFAKWFGPKGFSAKVHKLDLRAGGVLHSCLVSPEGHEIWAKFIYREVTPPAKLAWEHSFSDKDGNITRHPGHASWPLKLLTTVSFGAVGDTTTISLTWVPLNASTEERKTFEDGMDSMKDGWTGTFEQLEEFLRVFKE
jgi:uncharacterized protein YndB with AHSA1/START domain